MLIALALLLGCSGGGNNAGQATRLLLVADTMNHRLLGYNAAFTTGESATLVLGQANFTAGLANQGGPVGANTMSGPTGSAVDTAGNLFVADSGNCRVLRLPTPFSNGMSATLVLGKAALTDTCVPGVAATATSLGSVGGLAFDSSGNLWVADNGNSRVLKYTPPFSNGMAATLAIGQASLSVSTGCNQAGAPAATTLCLPNFIVFDSAGNLWVGDGGNSRALKYSPPFANGMTATVAIGQPGLISNSCLSSATGMCSAVGVVFDHAGNLWVGDDANCRVLKFTPPFSTNMAASLELGQPAGAGQLTESCTVATTTQSALFDADGLAFESNGSLFVADAGNNRTLVFSPPFISGMNAALVIGQANFTSGGLAAPAAATQNLPFGVATSF
jgi:sugar lactone lactonase YvrE